MIGRDTGHQSPVDLVAAEPLLVADCFVNEALLVQPVVAAPLVGVDGRSRQDVLHDESVERLLGAVREDEEQRVLGLVLPRLREQPLQLGLQLDPGQRLLIGDVVSHVDDLEAVFVLIGRFSSIFLTVREELVVGPIGRLDFKRVEGGREGRRDRRGGARRGCAGSSRGGPCCLPALPLLLPLTRSLLALVLPLPKLLKEVRVLDGVGRSVDLGETEDSHSLLLQLPAAPILTLTDFHLVDLDDLARASKLQSAFSSLLLDLRAHRLLELGDVLLDRAVVGPAQRHDCFDADV